MIGDETKGDGILLLIMDQDIPIAFLLNRRVFTLVLICFDSGNVLKLERYRQDWRGPRIRITHRILKRSILSLYF